MRAPRLLSALAALLALGACLGDSPGAPEPPTEVGLVLSFTGPQGVLADAFDEADNLTIWIDLSGIEEIRVDRTDIGGDAEIDVRIPVELPEGVDHLTGTVELHLRRGTDLLFEAQSSVVVDRGRSSEVTLQLRPVAATVVLSPTSMSLEAGEQDRFTATVLFATGDEIPDPVVNWSTEPSSCGITVDSNGNVSALLAGTCTVVARSGDAVATATVTVTSPLATIQGEVTAEGQPLSGIIVSVSGPTSASASTGQDGSYRLDGLQPGTYVLNLGNVPPDYSCPTTQGSIDVAEGEVLTLDFTCTVVRTASISGEVTRGTSPLSGVTVSISGPDGSETTSTSSSGLYSFSELRSGSYDVEISPPDGVTCPTTSTTVELSAGGSATADFECDPPPLTGYALVTNEGAGTVSVIDVPSGTVVGTLTVGSAAYDVAFSPDGTRAYVTNTSSGTVSVIDMTSPALTPGPGGGELAQTVLTTISVGSGPRGVGVLPDGSRAYVANASSGNVSVIDTGSNVVLQTISIGPHQPDAVAVHPAGTIVVVTLFGLDEINAIDPSTNTVVATDVTGDGPLALDITPDGNVIYIANFSSHDVTAGTIGGGVTTIPVGTNPAGVAVSPDGSQVYVTNYMGNSVSVIDTGSMSVVNTIPVPNNPHGVAFSPDGSIAYVTNYNGGTVTVIDVAGQSIIGTIPVGINPSRVAFQPMMP